MIQKIVTIEDLEKIIREELIEFARKGLEIETLPERQIIIRELSERIFRSL